MRKARGALVAIAALASLACASALREPPPVEEIAASGDRGAPEAAALEAPELLRRADAAWARRPDRTAVLEAQGLYLAAARAEESGVDGLLGAARASSWLVEHESDPAARQQQATTAIEAAQWCGRRAPEEPACGYRLALAIGQQARERPATAKDGMARMDELLRATIAVDPALDEAGPHRALALLLLRAPSWPAGPGDAEEGLAQAKAAAALRPEHPPNQLVLAEALSKNGEREGARLAAERSVALARSRLECGDPDAAEWVEDASALLERL